MTEQPGGALSSTVTMEEHWRDLVTAALLGTDRRDPPEPVGPLVDLVADTARSAPSERMLAQVAACTAVRRAGVLPGPMVDPLAPPDEDLRPICIPAAAERWQHISRSWPVLEDEWILVLIRNGWRLSPELIPAMLLRHRKHPVRRARVVAAAGPSAGWLADHIPALSAQHPAAAIDAELLAELPALPIPPDLIELLDATGAETGGALGQQLESGGLVHAHRAVLVNLLARVRSDALVDIADVLSSVDSRSSGHALATVLADLATTRHRMLDELSVSP